MHPLMRAVGVLVAAAAAFFTVVPAMATEASTTPTPTTTTWSVAPAGPDGPDDRRRIELDVDPGDIVRDYIAIRNFGTEPTSFSLSAADGYLTENGKFNMLTRDRESVDAGTWISLPQDVEVAAGATIIVPIEIAVPDQASPGDHVAGIAASIKSDKVDGSGVGVESRVGIRALFRVSGDVGRSLTVTSVGVDYQHNINPFLPGHATTSTTFQNTGNSVLRVRPSITVSGPFGWAARSEEADEFEIFPGASHSVTQSFSAMWPLGLIVATSQAEFEADRDSVIQTTVTAPAVPWPQLALIVMILGIFTWVVRARVASRQRLDALLEAARNEGAASVRKHDDG